MQKGCKKGTGRFLHLRYNAMRLANPYKLTTTQKGDEMPRQPRRLSKSGMYHIVFRGVSHCHLFEEQEDFTKLLELLSKVKEELSLKVYAYCFLDNHCHLLIEEESPGLIITAMRKLLSTYAFWFNRKYLRSGTLISNRYKSECVEDESYLLALIRYIHQNPYAAGIVDKLEAYRYSSYKDYVKNHRSLVDTGFVLGMFSTDRAEALIQFIAFHNDTEKRDYSLSDKTRKPEGQIHQEICSALGSLKPSDVCGLPKQERDTVLATLRKSGLTIKQIERATGISQAIIARSVSKAR